MIMQRTTRSGRRRRGPGRGKVLRDVATFVLAWGIVYQQALNDQPPSWPLLLTVGALLGVPGAAEVLGRLWSGMGSSGSESPSSPSPSSSLTRSGGDEDEAE